jgi:hypothetical protein
VDTVELLLWALAAIMIIGGLIGVIYPLLPGLPLMFGGLWIGAWADDFKHVGAVTLTVLGLMVGAGIICDFLASTLGAQRVGASPQAVTGALLGSVVGLFFGLPGLLIGPFAGAVLGELSARRTLGRAAEVGLATWVGLLLGALAKLAIALAMLGLFALAWFV